MEDWTGAGGESVLERAGETLGETRTLVFWIFFGGLPSEDEDEDELDESLELS